MTTLSKYFIVLLLGLFCGYWWASSHYNPIIKFQEQRIEALDKAYTKLISKHFIVDYKKKKKCKEK